MMVPVIASGRSNPPGKATSCIKTGRKAIFDNIHIVRPNGTVTLTTRSRGKTPWRWLDALKGKKHLAAV